MYIFSILPQVSTDPALGNPTILKIGSYALLATVWEANVTLDNETTYYWRVRAMGSNTSSDWSSVSFFTTGSPPLPKEAPALVSAPAPAPPPPAPPSPPAQPAAPDWLIYLVGPLILTIVLLLVTILVLALRRH